MAKKVLLALVFPKSLQQYLLLQHLNHADRLDTARVGVDASAFSRRGIYGY